MALGRWVRFPVTVAMFLVAAASHVTVGHGQLPARPPILKGRTAEVLRHLSPAQLVHAKLHVGAYDVGDQGRQILDERFSVSRSSNRIGGLRAARPTTEILSEFVCASDAVFVGQVMAAPAMPTLTGAFLFTDYEVRILDLIRSRLKSPLPFQVVVTRLGGVTSVDGVQILAESSNWPLLKVGETYMFFGTLIPDTGAFISRNSDVLRITDGKARAVAGLNDTSDLEWYEGLNAPAFTAQARATRCG